MSDLALLHLASYGQRGASLLMGRVQSLPVDLKNDALEAALDRLHRGSHLVAKTNAQVAIESGMGYDEAAMHGIMVALNTGALQQLHDVGRGDRPFASDKPSTELGCASCRSSSKPIGALNPTFRNQVNQQAKDTNSNITKIHVPVPAIQVGSLLFHYDTLPDMVQIVGCASPQYKIDGRNQAAGVQTLSHTMQATILTVLQTSTDDTLTIHSSMVHAGPDTRYGNLKYFFDGFDLAAPNFRVNKDYIGLLSMDDSDGEGAENKEPEGPVISSKHPITGEVWGIYLYLVVPTGSQNWGCEENPVSMLLKWQKVKEQDCLDKLGLTGTNIAEAIATGFLAPTLFLPALFAGDFLTCLIWKGVKWLAAEVIDLVEAIVAGVGAILCDIVCTPGLAAGLIGAGAATKDPKTKGILIASGAGAMIGANECCPPVAPPPAPAFEIPWVPLLAVFGGIVVVKSMNKKDAGKVDAKSTSLTTK